MIKNGQLDNPDGYRLDGNRLVMRTTYRQADHGGYLLSREGGSGGNPLKPESNYKFGR